MENKKILVGISGSFCNHHLVLEEVKKLAAKNEIQIVLSKNVSSLSTRFYNCIDFMRECESITKKPLIKTIVEAELIGPNNPYDIMLIVPMSATACSRLYYGHYDCPLTLAAKAMIRNRKNVVIGFASNDGLGMSGKNLFALLNQKNIYAVPFGQDDAIRKPNSLVAHWKAIEATLDYALKNEQIQPILLAGVNYE